MLAILSLAACSTIPKVTDPSGVDISVTQLSSSQIHSYYGINVSGDLNPFVPPGGFLSRQSLDYIVLRITVAAARPAEITLERATAVDAAGAQVAKLYTWPEFQSLLERSYSSGRDYQQVYGRARNAYMETFDQTIKPGRYSYEVVLVGKHPMPLPVKISVDIVEATSGARTFNLDVTKLD